MIIFLLGILFAAFLLICIAVWAHYSAKRSIAKMREEYMASCNQNSYEEDLFLQDLAFNADLENYTIVHYHNTLQ